GTDTGTVVNVARGDLNGDGHDDLVAVTGEGYVIAHDVRNQVLLWKSTRMEGAGKAVAVADLDGDAVPEVVALSDSRLYVFGKAPGSIGYVEKTSLAVSGGIDLVVAAFDGTGAPQVAVFSGGFLAPAGVTRYSSTLASLGSVPLTAPAQALALEDLGPGRRNLVVSMGDQYIFSGSTPAFLKAIDPVSGAEIWHSPPLWSPVIRGSISYADLFGSGHRGLALGSGLGMMLVR